MIDGELYMLDENNSCVFAYCERGRYKTSFYIGVTSWNYVAVSRASEIRTMATDKPCSPANRTAKERFNNLHAQKGYKWNAENKIIFKDGEVIRI